MKEKTNVCIQSEEQVSWRGASAAQSRRAWGGSRRRRSPAAFPRATGAETKCDPAKREGSLATMPGAAGWLWAVVRARTVKPHTMKESQCSLSERQAPSTALYTAAWSSSVQPSAICTSSSVTQTLKPALTYRCIVAAMVAVSLQPGQLQVRCDWKPTPSMGTPAAFCSVTHRSTASVLAPGVSMPYCGHEAQLGQRGHSRPS